MIEFVASLFGCTHHNCTFPMTAKVRGEAAPPALPEAGKPAPENYVVCLDCGKEFGYDWQKMKKFEMKKIPAVRVA
jgi:hypothetical protein